MRKFLLLFSLLLSPIWAAEQPPQAKQAAIEVVDQFVEGCFMYYPYPDKFSAWIGQLKYQKLSASEAAPYLAGSNGEAWSAITPNSKFILTSLNQSACTVFANGLDAETTKGMVKGFLGYLETQGATYSVIDATPSGAKPGYSSVNYSITMGGHVVAHITLSMAPPSTGSFQVALTVAKG